LKGDIPCHPVPKKYKYITWQELARSYNDVDIIIGEEENGEMGRTLQKNV